MYKNKNLSPKAQEIFDSLRNNEPVDVNYISGHLPEPIPFQNVYYMEKDSNGNDFAKRVSPEKLLAALGEVASATNVEDRLIHGTVAYNNVASAAGTLAQKGYGFYWGQYSVDMTKTSIPAVEMLVALKKALASAIIPTPSNKYTPISKVYTDEQDIAEITGYKEN